MRKKNKNGYTKGLKRAFEKYRWWDHSYMIDFEREIWKHWEEVYSHPEKYHVMGDAPRRLPIAKLAVKLLNFMNESIIERVDPNDDLEWESIDEIEGARYSKLVHIPEYKLMNGKYVNTKNARRFWNYKQYEFMFRKGALDAFKLQELYDAKVWHLYCRLKEQYLQEMWD